MRRTGKTRQRSCTARGVAMVLITSIGGCEVQRAHSLGASRRPAGPPTVYVANATDDSVTPIAAGSNRAGRPIRVGRAPVRIAISPDGLTAYVVGAGSLTGTGPVTLTPISTATQRTSGIIPVCARGSLFDGGAIAITPDSRTAYVSCPGSGLDHAGPQRD